MVDFLSVEDILNIHCDQLERYGGIAGIRDMGLLESAVAMPKATFSGDYLHGDIFEMATAYLFHIGKNHPFLDGNKRTGTVATLVFLLLNGYSLQVDDESLTKIVLDVMTGNIDKTELAQFFRNHCHFS